MSAEPKRVTKTEVWVGWENQVVNSDYPLRRWLGGSNHSAVFLTEYRPEGITQAAIKLVPADTLETEAQLVQWGTAATLNHPHLIRLFDVGRCHIGGRVYLYVVMEYADQTLAQLLPRRALSPDETREMLIPALSALNYLHRNGLVQGQVKPTNLLVVGDQLKLASDTIRPAGKLSSGILRASLHDPPELKDGEIGPAGDIWGLGVTLVEALTQHPPSWPDSKAETVSLTASIPPLFVDTVRRCLNRIPSARPTAGELERQFNPAVHAHPITVVAAEEPVYEVATVSTASNDSTTPRKGPGGGVLVLGVAAVLVLGLAVWVSRTIFVGQVEPEGSASAAAGAVAQPADSGTIAATVADTSASRADVSSAPSAEAEGLRGASSGRVAAEDGRTAHATGVATARATGVASADTTDAAPAGRATAAAAPADTLDVASARSGVATATPAATMAAATRRGISTGTAATDRLGTSTATTTATATRRGVSAGTAATDRLGTSTATTTAATDRLGTSTTITTAATDRLGTSTTITTAAGSRPGTSTANAAAAPSLPRVAVGSPAAAAAPTSGTASPVGTAYATSRSLAPNADLSAQAPDIVGSVLHQQLPDIPHNIREKIRGHVNVTVRVLVDPSGNVVGEFLENAGPSHYFARQAGDAAIDWKFVPTDGRGPRVWMLKFEFTRTGTTVRTVGTQ